MVQHNYPLHSIEWHEQCLKNRRKSVERDQNDLDYLEERILIANDEIKFYEKQIEEAKNEV